MSEREAGAKGVNRLHDIVVEEVSLVDRAANKHRFLIVKRSDEMNEEAPDSGESNGDELNATAGGAGDTNADQVIRVDDKAKDVASAAAGGPPGDGGDELLGGDAALDLAIDALEGLTETVAMLGGGSDSGGSRTRLSELAGELRAVSQQLAVFAGGTAEAAEPHHEPEAAAAKPKPDSGAVKPEPAAAARPASDLTTPLAALAAELRALNSAVSAQHKRIAQIEKRFGMPNSRAAGEQPTRAAGDDDIGWPLDMNRALDRDSVDKSTSFHDV